MLDVTIGSVSGSSDQKARIMSTVLRLMLAILLSGPLAAQTILSEPARNAVFLELGGNGGLYSVNFERQFTNRLTLRMGCGAFTLTDAPFCFSSCDDSTAEVRMVLAPLLVNYLHGSGNHKLELGGGVVVGEESRSDHTGRADRPDIHAAVTGVLGYRYQRPAAGLIFRAGATPIYAGGEFFPLIGVSLGYAYERF